jgi:hypothetical protein
LVGVAEAEQEVRQDVHDVGLEEAAEHVAELGEGEEGALAVPRIFLILPPYLVLYCRGLSTIVCTVINSRY